MDDDLWPGLAGLIVLGVVVAILALGYFVWVFYQLRNPDRRKANVMEHLLDQLNGAIDGIASCLADPIHDEWFQTGKATQTLKEAARRLNDIAHGIQIERDQYLELMSE